ncbi:hypothetical protein, partial [Salmonella enterica]|uniref:hypothetical protein n=1 Tax=Salmonella enterica TaxID=28901 RepID=UPI000900568C
PATVPFQITPISATALIMSVVWTDVTRIRSREEKKNEENRNGTRKLPLVSRREYSSLRYHTALFMTV